jgi:putative nucleotidyltransferase with HDIG domain
MAFPLKIGEEIIGAIQLHQGGPGVLSAEDERLMLIFAERAALALERTRLLEQITQHLRRLTVLHTIDLAITTSMDLHVTLAVLLDQVMPELEADGASVLLYNPEERLLRSTTSRGVGGELNSRQQFQLSECLAGQVILNNLRLLVPDLQNYAHELQDSQDNNGVETTLRQDILLIQSQGFNAYFGMPLVAKGQVNGVLEVFRRTSFHPDAEWLNFLQAASESAAIAIDNATLFNNLQKSNLDLAQAYDATLEGWSRALDLRDVTTNDHTQRVTEMTLNLARVMGINTADLIHVRRGALLHDIGKMGVPDHNLLKPGALTDEEWQIMRMHPDYAYQLLKPVEYLRPALDIPYCHHEKWDGSGYPRGLKWEEIPLVARIFAVVDVWDALCSDRPYRPAWSPERTRDYILSQSGIHFDPQVVEAFIQMI